MKMTGAALRTSLRTLHYFTGTVHWRMMSALSHVGRDGQARMVDVGEKALSQRTAVARGKVVLGEEIYNAVKKSESGGGGLRKGPVLATAQLAGIMAAKKTPDLIPLCHTVMLSSVNVDLSLDEQEKCIQIEATATTAEAQTGVEMEALAAVSVAALTVYDMCKAAGRGMIISDIKLVTKTGGKSGDFDLRKR